MASCGLEKRPMLDDFIVTVHALERFQERFPTLWTNDEDVGLLIYEETMEAIDAGRVSTVAPLELATYDLNRWAPGKARFVWVSSKERGYVILNGNNGLTVATVLVGQTTEAARSRLYARKKSKTTGSSRVQVPEKDGEA